MPERPCSRCAQPMSVGRYGPLELDICRPCGGIWFDCGELPKLMSAGPQMVRRLGERVYVANPPAVAGQIGTRPCPICRSRLDGVLMANMSGITLESCQWCEGYWVEGDMLYRLSAALDGRNEFDHLARAQHTQLPTAAPPPPSPAAAPQAPVSPSGIQAGPGWSGCPHCDEPNAPRAAVCWACGQALQGPAVGKCPHCDGIMRRIMCEQVSLDACEGCSGVWITPNRLNQILVQPGARRQRLVRQIAHMRGGKSGPLRQQLTCPHCKQVMFNSPLGVLTRLPVHTCSGCFAMFLTPAVLQDVLFGRR